MQHTLKQYIRFGVALIRNYIFYTREVFLTEGQFVMIFSPSEWIISLERDAIHYRKFTCYSNFLRGENFSADITW